MPAFVLAIRRTLWLLAIPLACAAARADETASIPALLDGVHEIAAPGVPGQISVFGERAFAVVAGKGGGAYGAVVAAAQSASDPEHAGRVVAFGHNGYLGVKTLETADTGRLLLNSIRWAAHGGAGAVAIYKLDALAAWLKTQGVDAKPGSPDQLGDARVFIADSHDLDKAQAASVETFVEGGGGLITAATGWGWEQITKRKLSSEFPANEMLAPWGLVFTAGTLERTGKDGFAAQPTPPPLIHAGRALETARAAAAKGAAPLADADAAQVSATLIGAAVALPPGDRIFLPALHSLGADDPAEVIPTHEHPLTKANPVGRLLLALQVHELESLPAAEVRPHPAAAVFPGAPPLGTQPVAVSVSVDARVPGWHSLGLYAAPGALLTVDIPAEASDKGLRLRIGAHTDSLWNLDHWRRAPQISREFPLNSASMQAANAFGGLVYVVAPDDCKLESVAVRINGAVAAPLYVRKKTDPAQWRGSIRASPGPWAELATDKIILTVPSSAIRNLEDPEIVLNYWDSGMDAAADLATIPRARKRPERIVADEQISAGYMHSGYPIMTGLDAAALAVDLPQLLHGDWGHWHEMGHNHQRGDWTFDGTGEVTCNLFSLYVNETVGGVPQGRAHPNVQDAWQQDALKKYLAGGAKFEEWKKDPFLALLMYIQLQREFGWQAYKKIFAEYRDLPDAERPKSDDEKRDQWMERFSRIAGRNLGPFFQAWGVPTSDKARESVAGLPGWMPADWPK